MRVLLAFVLAACCQAGVGAQAKQASSVFVALVADGFTAPVMLAFDPSSEEAGWVLKGSFQTPVVVVDRIRIDRDCPDELEFRVDYQFAGEVHANRRMMVEVVALDSSGVRIAHSWVIETDARIGPHEFSMGPSTLTRSDRNSANVALPTAGGSPAASYRIVLRPLSAADLGHLPESPHKLQLALKRQPGDERLAFVFANGRALDPARHEIAFILHVHDAEGKFIERRVRFLPYRTDGRYEVCHCLPRQYWEHSSVSIAVYTIQNDNEQFRRRFFVEGKGSAYRGIWTGDGGAIARLPFEDSAYR